MAAMVAMVATVGIAESVTEASSAAEDASTFTAAEPLSVSA